MSICKRLGAVLRKRGWILKTVPTADAERVGELIDLLCQDNADGRQYRNALRYWRAGERPVIERFAGYGTWLEIEGPCYVSGGQGYALGSQLHDGERWFNLYPNDTNDLVRELREAIDQVLQRWAQNHGGKGLNFDLRTLRDRTIDDDTAREMIMAYARRSRSKEPCSHDQ